MVGENSCNQLARVPDGSLGPQNATATAAFVQPPTAFRNLADWSIMYNATGAVVPSQSCVSRLIGRRRADIKANRSNRGGRPATRMPMTTFDKREEGFEKQFAHDEELRFRATARRNKLLGLWAASKLGLAGADADTYAKAVVASDFEEAGDHDVFRKVRADLDTKKVAGVSDQEIRKTMDELLVRAVAEIKAGR